MPARSPAALTRDSAQIDPASDSRPLFVCHVRLVGGRHGTRDDGPFPNSSDARDNLFRRVEYHARRRGAKRDIGRLRRMTPGAPAIDDMASFSEAHRPIGYVGDG